MDKCDWKDLLSIRNYIDRYGSYFLLSIGIFCIGIIAGIVSGAKLFPLIENVVPVSSPAHATVEQIDFFEEFTTSSIFFNNTQAFMVSLVGLISGGLASVYALLLNGVVIGLVSYIAIQELELLTIIALLLPHGIIEISVFAMSGAITFRFTHQIIKAFQDKRQSIITSYEVVEILLIISVSFILLLLAAWIEVNITPDIGSYVIENYSDSR